jgi:alkylation response protein AidB-like acyl-CoA dehydrogenase
LLAATLPREPGGAGIGGSALCAILRRLGSGNLPLGRLFEGHVNAIGPALGYGSRDQVRLVADEAKSGRLFGVWNTDETANPLLLLADGHGGNRLHGRKILFSGAGHFERPLVTDAAEAGIGANAGSVWAHCGQGCPPPPAAP